MLRIDLFSDVVCPWCFIGKRRLERAMAARPDTPVEIRWRAFQLNPDMPPGGMPRRHYLAAKFGGPERARRVYEAIGRAGASVGLDFAFDRIERAPNTADAHRLVRWAGEEGAADALVERLFRAYFLEGSDIGARDALLAAAAACGLDAEEAGRRLETGEGAREVAEENRLAQRNGITGVPFFVFNRRYAVSGAQEPEAFLPLFDLGPEAELQPAGTAG